MLLNKRRILRRRGKFLEADVLADKINAIIQRKQSESLSNLTSQSTKNYGQLMTPISLNGRTLARYLAIYEY